MLEMRGGGVAFLNRGQQCCCKDQGWKQNVELEYLELCAVYISLRNSLTVLQFSVFS